MVWLFEMLGLMFVVDYGVSVLFYLFGNSVVYNFF